MHARLIHRSVIVWALSSANRTSLRHVPALDGLRGVALLGVLFFHANGALPGGYLGVDLFFVLSGYLITSLLLAEHRELGHIALSSFWVRRAKRLFPALLSLMPVIAIYGRFFAKPSELQALRADALATLSYVANWSAIFSHKSYWELFASPSPLEHTWSLSIEEQFYVVWPLIVMLVLRRGTRYSVLALTLVLTGLSMVAMLALYNPAATTRAYLGTDTRAAGILAGAALATVLPPNTTFQSSAIRRLDLLGLVAALGLGVAWCKLDGEAAFLYRGGFWLTEIAALILIVCAVAGPTSIVARVLSFRPLTLVGTLSYGIYLWHWPVNVFLSPGRMHVHGPWLHVMQFALTFAIAIVSYRVLERPIRMRGLPFGRPIYMVPAAVALSIVLLVRATNARQPSVSPGPSSFFTDAGHAQGTDVAFRVLLVGDSTANSLGWGLRGVHKQGVDVELMGQDGCTMLWDACYAPTWAQRTTDLHPNATLVVLGGAFLHGLTLDDGWRKSCYPGWDTQFESALVPRLRDLKSSDGRVWAVTIPYTLGPWETSVFRAEVDCINASIRKAAGSVDGVRVLELGERLCPNGVCAREFEGAEIRPDGLHYSVEGAADISRWVFEQIQP